MGQILSQPVTKKEGESGENASFVFGVSSMQGWRISMEDAHAAVLDLNGDAATAYFGVYDGHGGERMAHFAGEKTHELVAASNAFQSEEKNIGKAFVDGFLGTDAAMLAKCGESGLDSSGCAATAAVITDKIIVCGNAGDSRTVLGRRGVAKPLSFDHKPDNIGETSRIEAAGGFVEMGRVNGNLALSRALGDFTFKRNLSLPPEEQIVTASPDIIEHTRDADDEFVILACDGIWDCMTSQQAIEFARRCIAEKLELEEICELMMEECLAPESDMSGIGCDNMTVCIVALLQPGQTKAQWFDMVAERVSKGDGPVLDRSVESIRAAHAERHANATDVDQGESDDPGISAMDASQIVQSLFGGDGVANLDSEAASLLSRIGIKLHMENPEDDEHDHDHEHEHEGDSRVHEVADKSDDNTVSSTEKKSNSESKKE